MGARSGWIEEIAGGRVDRAFVVGGRQGKAASNSHLSHRAGTEALVN